MLGIDSENQWASMAAFERMALMRFLGDRNVPNPIVLTGDIHSSWANELRVDDRKHDDPVVAAEFVGTSITSGGDGNEQPANVTNALGENPHVKWQNSRRGYVSCRVDAKEWTADYKTVAFVSKPGAPLDTPTKWRVEYGRPGIQKL